MTDDDTGSLGPMHEAFDDARGEPGDGLWSWAVAWRLLRQSVEPDLVREGLQEALDLVRETQESPADLFGTPEEHSDALYERWVEEGRLRLWDASHTTWGEVPSFGLGTSAVVSVGFLVVLLLRGETTPTWSVGMVLLPVGLGLVIALVSALHDTLLRSRGAIAAAAGSVGVLAASSLVLAVVNEVTRSHPIGTGSTWWYVPVAGACALLAIAWRRWWDARPVPTEAIIADADDWSRELAGILRSRYTMSDARVHEVVGDAHAHAADAGRRVQDEFGTPEDYAATFRPDVARGWLLSARLHAAMAVSWALATFAGMRWGPVLAVLWALLAWQAYRRYGDLTGGPDSQDGPVEPGQSGR
ncbi:hypothetical protein [Nocardioides zeicaulis]|uniref:DUF2207 domain-containing protein n=1 Tax=Nocardioides zeicaulis TaxID=1776857 RepID=A0ABV6E135_9ACTN